MTKAEAEHLFIGRGDDSYLEYYQELLFDYKKFFAQSVPIRKIFNSRLKKLRNLIEAYTILNEKEPVSVVRLNDVDFTDEVKQAFDQYTSLKSEVTLKISQSIDGEEIAYLSEYFLCQTERYAEKWFQVDADLTSVKVGVEPNPMDLFKAVNEFLNLKKSTFNEINELPQDHLLVVESKRLTLLCKMKENA